jgi:hypothetical protein
MAIPHSTGQPRERKAFSDIIKTRIIQCPCKDGGCVKCDDWLSMSELLAAHDRYQAALQSIFAVAHTRSEPKTAFVEAWHIALDALSLPPTAAEVEAQPGSEILCPRCAHVFCPSDDPLHFHHDGCPSCSEEVAQPMCDCDAHRQLQEAHAREQVKRMRDTGMQTGPELGGHMCMCGHCSHSHFKNHPHVRDGCSACSCTDFVPPTGVPKVIAERGREGLPLRPTDTLSAQWLNTEESLAVIKSMDVGNEIVFAADGTPALEIDSPGREVERVEVGDYVVRRVVGGLAAMKAAVFDLTQEQIGEVERQRLLVCDCDPHCGVCANCIAEKANAAEGC